MNKFDEETNSKIFEACQNIKSYMSTEALLYTTPTARKIVKDLKEGSKIYESMKKYEWEKLFSNKSWLAILSGTQNLSVEGLTEPLKTLREYFPTETKGYIFPEFLF